MHCEHVSIAGVDFVMAAHHGKLVVLDFLQAKNLNCTLERVQRYLVQLEAQAQVAKPNQESDPNAGAQSANATLLAQARTQLTEYFAQTRKQFSLPLLLAGTAFQRKVWQALQTIPYGQTITYLQLAHHIGQPLAVRAVAAANGANALPIVVPCHRVIGSNGRLTGFGGGLALKQRLLLLEQQTTAMF